MENDADKLPAASTAALQSDDHRGLLDIIDKLRSEGIGRYVDLPQIIVCGDQSSGKSSVLEAISGMSFPTKDNLCTRFATELILRRNSSEGINICIIPGADRSDEEKVRLGAFTRKLTGMDIGEVVEDAKDVMGLTTSGKVFSNDILRVEISGPSQPHLTMVDLPGLFLAGNKDQSAEDAKLVESLVLSYMEKPRSIILAVVSAKSDFALQQVTQRARGLDPKGLRTLGLITKPDTLDEGSDSERFYAELAQNKDVEFRLGWHVLRNRDYAMRHATTAERDSVESEFFSKGVWTALHASQLGVVKLRTRLSNVLKDQILLQLPSVLEDVEVGIKDAKHKLEKLGASRATLALQRRYLFHASQQFCLLVKAAVNGEYTDSFFHDIGSTDGYQKRLRAVVQNTLSDFAETMRKEGHAREITEAGVSGTSHSRCVSRSQYLQEVKVHMKNSRGRELPGSFNPLIVSELFSQQCKPWNRLVQELVKQILDLVYVALNAILQHVVDDQTAQALLQEIINPSMDELKQDLNGKVTEILEPHLSGHPITYNHYLTDNVQKAQAARHKRDLEGRYKSVLQKDATTEPITHYTAQQVKKLLEGVIKQTEPDMDRYSCSTATDLMEAYYKVALKKVVDDIGVLAIERCLIQKLPGLLDPEIIFNLGGDDIKRIAAEGEDSATERARLKEKLEVLETGMIELSRLKKLPKGATVET